MRSHRNQPHHPPAGLHAATQTRLQRSPPEYLDNPRNSRNVVRNTPTSTSIRVNGNRTLRTKISDNTKTEYTWDHRNRLTGVKFKTAGGTVTKEIQYSYDVYNRLVRRRLDADGAGAGGFTDTFWAYDGDNPILEFAGGTATAPSHRYLWGPAVDQILADEQVATGSPNDVRWPMTDWQGTVRDVATYNAATNVTTIANHKVYEAFGKVHSESGPTVDTIFGYTARYFDDDAGLQWNLNRANKWDRSNIERDVDAADPTGP